MIPPASQGIHPGRIGCIPLKHVEATYPRFGFAAAALLPFHVFGWIGRFVVDFGFASLLDKFEEHYGKRAGKVLVGLIGAAVTSVCLGLIWGFLQPIYLWATESAAGTSMMWLIWRGATAFAALAVLFFGGAAVAAAFEAKNLVRKSEELISDTYATFEEAMRALERLRDIAHGAEAGSKIVDIDPERTAKLIGDAKGKLGEIRKVQTKMKTSGTSKRSPTTGKG